MIYTPEQEDDVEGSHSTKSLFLSQKTQNESQSSFGVNKRMAFEKTISCISRKSMIAMTCGNNTPTM